MLEDLPSKLDRGPLDPVRIFEALQRHGVEYLPIGAVAVNAHGHVRNTRDVDILIEWSAENMQRLAAALGDLDAKLFGVDADLPDVHPRDPEELLNGGDFTLRTAAGASTSSIRARSRAVAPTRRCAGALWKRSSRESASARSASMT